MKHLLLTKIALIEQHPFVAQVHNPERRRRWQLYHEAHTAYNLIVALAGLSPHRDTDRLIRLMRRASERANRRLIAATEVQP